MILRSSTLNPFSAPLSFASCEKGETLEDETVSSCYRKAGNCIHTDRCSGFYPRIVSSYFQSDFKRNGKGSTVFILENSQTVQISSSVNVYGQRISETVIENGNAKRGVVNYSSCACITDL